MLQPDGLMAGVCFSRRGKQKLCMVCGDKALSCNFGAITCESCKAFFRRHATKKITGQCNETCHVAVPTRAYCRKCRLLKCFSVGMRTDLILSDDQKRERREKIRENRMRRHIFPNSDHQEDSSKGSCPNSSSTVHNYMLSPLMVGGVTPQDGGVKLTSHPSQGTGYVMDNAFSFSVGQSQAELDGPPYFNSKSHITACTFSGSQIPQTHTESSNRPCFAEVPLSSLAACSEYSKNSDFPLEHVLDSTWSQANDTPDTNTTPYSVTKNQFIPSPNNSIILPNAPLTDAVDPNSSILPITIPGAQFRAAPSATPKTTPHASPNFSLRPSSSLPFSSGSGADLDTKPGVLKSGENDNGTSEIPRAETTYMQGAGQRVTPTEMPNVLPRPRPVVEPSSTSFFQPSAHPNALPCTMPSPSPSVADNPVRSAIHEAGRGAKPSPPKPSSSKQRQPVMRRCDHFYPTVSDQLLMSLDARSAASIRQAITAVENSFNKKTGLAPAVMEYTQMFNMGELAIRKIIQLAKQIPEFCQLESQDQITLLKNSVVEILIIRSSKTFDPNTLGWNVPLGGSGTSHQVSSEAIRNHNPQFSSWFKQYTAWVTTLSRLIRKDDAIIMIVIIVRLFTYSGNNALKDAPSVIASLRHYTRLLALVIEDKYTDRVEAHDVFTSIQSVLNELDTINNIQELILRSNIGELEPLIVEIFDIALPRKTKS